MKKIYLVALVTLIPTIGFAQGGSWYVGGIAGYNASSTNDVKSSSWSFGPEVGTFLNAKWSAGLALGFGGEQSKNDLNNYSSVRFQPDLYVRHWCPVADRLNLFVGLDLTFGTGKSKIMGTESKSTLYGANLNAGLTYALADRWTLLMKFAGLGYTSTKIGGTTTSNFNLLADGNVLDGQFMFIGLYWTFITAN